MQEDKSPQTYKMEQGPGIEIALEYCKKTNAEMMRTTDACLGNLIGKESAFCMHNTLPHIWPFLHIYTFTSIQVREELIKKRTWLTIYADD